MSGLTTLNGNVTDPAATTIDFAAVVPSGTRLLIDSEVVLVGAISSGTTSHVTRAYNGTTGATHTSGAQCYNVVKVQNTGSIMVYYIDGATTKMKSISVTEDPASGDTVTLSFTAPTELTDSTTGTPAATLTASTAHMTDSSGGTPSATSPPTVVTVGVTNTGDVSAAIKNNFATLNAHINALDAIYINQFASLNAQINALQAAVAAMTGSVS